MIEYSRNKPMKKFPAVMSDTPTINKIEIKNVKATAILLFFHAERVSVTNEALLKFLINAITPLVAKNSAAIKPIDNKLEF